MKEKKMWYVDVVAPILGMAAIAVGVLITTAVAAERGGRLKKSCYLVGLIAALLSASWATNIIISREGEPTFTVVAKVEKMNPFVDGKGHLRRYELTLIMEDGKTWEVTDHHAWPRVDYKEGDTVYIRYYDAQGWGKPFTVLWVSVKE